MRKGIFQRISGDFEHFWELNEQCQKHFFEEKKSIFGKGLDVTLLKMQHPF